MLHLVKVRPELVHFGCLNSPVATADWERFRAESVGVLELAGLAIDLMMVWYPEACTAILGLAYAHSVMQRGCAQDRMQYWGWCFGARGESLRV